MELRRNMYLSNNSPVGHGLKKDTGGGDPLGICHEAVGEMTAVG